MFFKNPDSELSNIYQNIVKQVNVKLLHLKTFLNNSKGCNALMYLNSKKYFSKKIFYRGILSKITYMKAATLTIIIVSNRDSDDN